VTQIRRAADFAAGLCLVVEPMLFQVILTLTFITTKLKEQLSLKILIIAEFLSQEEYSFAIMHFHELIL